MRLQRPDSFRADPARTEVELCFVQAVQEQVDVGAGVDAALIVEVPSSRVAGQIFEQFFATFLMIFSSFVELEAICFCSVIPGVLGLITRTICL